MASYATVQINRVPNVTVDFWLVKLLAVTMGETAADYLAVNLGLGLTKTTMIMSAILLMAIALQFSRRRYVPWTYWSTVVLVSVVGTLLTDNLTDSFGVPLTLSTPVFGGLLALTFVVWYAAEGTLSIHKVYTFRRELFYWLAILLTFALGTAAGDLVAESFGFGYVTTGLLFLAVIAAIACAWSVLSYERRLGFWLAYIFTRPLGASFGDLPSQPQEYGGMGLGTTLTSLISLLHRRTRRVHVDRGNLRADDRASAG